MWRVAAWVVGASLLAPACVREADVPTLEQVAGELDEPATPESSGVSAAVEETGSLPPGDDVAFELQTASAPQSEPEPPVEFPSEALPPAPQALCEQTHWPALDDLNLGHDVQYVSLRVRG